MLRLFVLLRKTLLLLTILLGGVFSAQGQLATLNYRPVAYQYSKSLDKIVLVSGNPNQLHLYDPIAQTDLTMALPSAPISLALSPDGNYALVGQSTQVTYISLASMTAIHTTPVTSPAVLVLGAAYAWIFPPNAYGIAINPTTGATLTTTNPYATYNIPSAVLNVNGTSLYLSGYGASEIDVSTGAFGNAITPANPANIMGGNRWLSADGSRIYTSGGTVVRASSDPSLDLNYVRGLGPGANSLAYVSAADSTTLSRLALIPYGTNDDQVQLFTTDFYNPAGTLLLSQFVTPAGSYNAHGKALFFNSTSANLYVIVQADSSAGLLNDYAIDTIPLAHPLTCAPSFSTATASVGAAGSLGSAAITATPDCQHTATSNAAWIQIVSGGYGSGNGTLTWIARPNTTTASRTGTISIGSQTFTISQAASPTSIPSLWGLSYVVVDAAYSVSLDKLITVSAGPNELHIYDPVSLTDQIVSLALPALCVSVSPDGKSAAVGHDGFVSYVNLNTASVTQVYPVRSTVNHVVLASNGYIYGFAANGILSLNISTGAVTSTGYSGGVARLEPNGNYIYYLNYDVSKLNISAGVATLISGEPYISNPSNFWLSQDGARLFTSLGTVYLTSDTPSQDLQSNGSLALARSVVWAANSSAAMTTAVIPGNSYSTNLDTQLQFYGDGFLGYSGSLSIPQTTVGGVNYAEHGTFVFWNSGSSKLFAITTADSSASLVSPNAVYTIGLTQLAPGCTATLGTNSVTAPATGGVGTVNVSAGQGCAWSSMSSAAWLTVASGGVGAGPGLVSWAAVANNTGASRSATINVAGQTFTVTQAPAIAGTAQTIAFGSLANQVLGVAPFFASAVSTSGLPVTIASSTPAVCSVVGFTVTVFNTGTCTLTGNQAGNSVYLAAPSVSKSFTVSHPVASSGLLPAPGQPISVANSSWLVANDFNRDGKLDLATPTSILLGNGTGGFTASTSPYPQAATPGTLATADFNGDGIPDLLQDDSSFSGGLNLLLGDGQGGFSMFQSLPIAYGITAAAFGDFNNDGRWDAAVADFGAGYIYLNRGGFFQMANNGSYYSFGYEPPMLAVADFDGDGNLDIVAPGSFSPSVTLFRGNGAGVYAQGVPISLGSTSNGAGSVITADFNGDGKPDIAVLANNQISVLLNNGAGSFTPISSPPTLSSGNFLTGFAAADMNGDGKIDLVAAYGSRPYGIVVFTGDGAGGFSAPAKYPTSQVSSVYQLVVGDFNGDGRMDVAYGTYVLVTNGNTQTQSPAIGLLLGAGQVASTSTLSTTSAATITYGQNVNLTLTVTAGSGSPATPSGTGTFLNNGTLIGVATQTGSPYTFGINTLPAGTDVLTAQYSGDVANGPSTSNSITIQVMQAPQTIGFTTPADVVLGVNPIVALSASATSGLAVTFTSNSASICTVSGSTVTPVRTGVCSITANQPGNGNYNAAPAVTKTFNVLPIGTTAQMVSFGATVAAQTLGAPPVIVPVSSTSGLPVTVASTTPGICSVTGAQSITIFIRSAGTCTLRATQSGSATYAAAAPVQLTFQIGAPQPAPTYINAPNSPLSPGLHPNSIAAADFNGDGKQDLVVGSYGSVSILLADATGKLTATPASPIPFGNSSWADTVVVGDFNLDGKADFAVASGSNNNLVVYLGDGTGGFTPKPAMVLSYSPSTMVVGDFNGDGKPDLALGTNFSRLMIMLGDGAGGFVPAPSSPIATSFTVSTLIVGDFNGDGIQDLVGYASGATSPIDLLLGDGAGNFSPWTGNPIAMTTGWYGVVAADFNQDGKLDIGYVPASGGLAVSLSNASGPFGFTAAAGSPFAGPNSFIGSATLAITDFNGDGFFDIIGGTGGSGALVRWQNDGTGRFTASVSVPIPSGVTQLAIADFNGDGIPDLAATGFSNSTSLYDVSVLLGSGKLTSTSVLSTTAPSSVPYGQPIPLTLSVSGNSIATLTGTATFLDGTTTLGSSTQVSSPFAYSVSSPSTGSHTYSAIYSGDTNNLASTSNSITIQVTQATQTITFGPIANVNFGASPFTVSATASSGLPVTYTSSTTSVCTLSGGTVTLVAPGTCAIVVNQVGNTNYAPATAVGQSFTVNPEPQTITFTPISNVTLPASTINLSATATSGLAVTFASSTSSTCVVQGSTVQPVAAGVCTVIASQSGNTTWAVAPSVSQSFTITAASSGGGGGGGGSPGGGTPLTASPSSVTQNVPAGTTGSTTVTLMYQTSTQGAPTFSTGTTTNQGYGWIGVSPLSGTMTLASYGGYLYTYTATLTVTMNSTGISAGNTYTGNVNVLAGGGVTSIPITMNVTSAQPAQLSAVPGAVNFTYRPGDSSPGQQSITIFSAPSGAKFTVSTGGASWLTAALDTVAPGHITLSVNTSGLSAGTLQTTLVVTPAAGSAISIPVKLTILPSAAPQLSVGPQTQTLSAIQGGSPVSAQVAVSNTGGGTLSWSAAAATQAGGSWLKLTGSSSGSATPQTPASVGFEADPSGLSAGVYQGSINFTTGGSTAIAGSAQVTVVVSPSGQSSIALSQNALGFYALVGGANPRAQFVTLFNPGTAPLQWSIRNTTGASWLSASQTSGTLSAGSSTTFSVGTNLANLAAGVYYGTLEVSSTGAVNSPQDITVSFSVAAPQTNAPVTVSTGGLVLTGTTAISGASTSISILNPDAAAVTYSTSVSTVNGVNWLSANPSSGTVNPGTSSLTIQASFSGLTAGVSTGSVAISFSNGSSATIQVIAIITGSGSGQVRTAGSSVIRPRDVAGCPGGKPSFVIPVIQQPLDQSTAKVSVPQSVQVQVIDDCGNAVTAAKGGLAQVTFSNSQGASDAPLTLNDIGNGVWIATWTPVNTGSPLILKASVSEGALSTNPSLNAGSTVSITVQAAPSDAAAQVAGVVNAAASAQGSPQVVAPGSYVAIYGTALSATGTVSATTLPLPTTLNGTQLLLGGKAMPLLFASPGQVNALVPEGLVPNAAYPLVVTRGSTVSAPLAIAVQELQPGIYTVDTSGSGAGIVTNATTGQLISASNPARAGDYLVVYCTGLGSLVGPNGEGEPADGAAAPGNLVYQTTSTVTATIGGVSAPVLFAGLTPGLAGLYQVNLQLPAGVTPGSTIPLLLTAADTGSGATAISNSILIVVQ